VTHYRLDLFLGIFFLGLSLLFIGANLDLDVMKAIFSGPAYIKDNYVFFRWISHFGEAQYLVIFLIFVWVCGWLQPRYHLKSRGAMFCYAHQKKVQGYFLLFLVSSSLLHLIKFICGRPRPSYHNIDSLPDWYWFGFDGRYGSLPSGHAMASMLLMLFLVNLWPKSRSILWIWPLVVGLSRVALAKHYPSDVFLGYALALISFALLKRYQMKNSVYTK